MNKRDNILNAAMHLFVDHGEQATSMKWIARKAECGIGTMYNYFPSKEKLINELYLEIKVMYSSYILEVLDPEKSIKHQIIDTWRRALEFVLHHPVESKYIELFCQSPIISEQLRRETMELFSPLIEIYETGKKEGIIKNQDTLQLLSFVKGAITASVMSQPEMNPEDIDAVVLMAWDAIRN